MPGQTLCLAYGPFSIAIHLSIFYEFMKFRVEMFSFFHTTHSRGSLKDTKKEKDITAGGQTFEKRIRGQANYSKANPKYVPKHLV